MSIELTHILAAQVDPWFDNAGLVGAVLGAGCGILGGVYGTTLGLLVPRGRGKPFVFGLHWVALTLGIALFAAGVTALVAGQPYGVWYALLLPGAILTTLLGVFTPLLIRVWYRQAEQRRLDAEEFRQS